MFSSTVKPYMALAGFKRVYLEPGEEKRVQVMITPRSMRTLGRDFVWRVEKGDFRVFLCVNAEQPVEHKDFRVE